MFKVRMYENKTDDNSETIFCQDDLEEFKIHLLINAPYRMENGLIMIRANVWDVLGDVLLGFELYKIQKDVVDIDIDVEITVSSDTEPMIYTKNTIFRLLEVYANANRNVKVIRLSKQNSVDAFEKMFKCKGGKSAMMDYQMECPSFEEFIKEKDGDVKKSKGKRESLNFAHPIDAGIIRILDNPVINKAFSKIVDLSIDADYGLLLSTGIRVDQKDKEMSEILSHCAETLNITVPYTVISSSVSGINAMTVGTDDFHFIAIGSLLKALMEKEEVMFVIGHECGHIALGHVVYHSVLNTARNASKLIPILGPAVYNATALPLQAWSRRSEISADRAGLLCCGDINVACKSLLKLEAGFMNTDNVDIDEYIKDTTTRLNQFSLGKFKELSVEHPILAKRMEALKVFAQSEKYYRLSNKEIPLGMTLIDDKELEKRTEAIVKVW